MNQLILEDDETCPLQNCRTKHDFPAHKLLALNQGFRQVDFVRPLEELREIKQRMEDKAAFYTTFQIMENLPPL